MCEVTDLEVVEMYARLLTEELDYTIHYTGTIEEGRFIIADDSDERVVIMDEPDSDKAADRFCDLSGWDVPF